MLMPTPDADAINEKGGSKTSSQTFLLRMLGGFQTKAPWFHNQNLGTELFSWLYLF